MAPLRIWRTKNQHHQGQKPDQRYCIRIAGNGWQQQPRYPPITRRKVAGSVIIAGSRTAARTSDPLAALAAISSRLVASSVPKMTPSESRANGCETK